MRLACLAPLALLPAAANAAERPLAGLLPPTREACFERHYDADHLARHPKQKVSALRLLHKPDSWSMEGRRQTLYVMIYFNLRERTTSGRFDYQISGFCKPAGKMLRCEPEWEAGHWRLVAGPRGTLDIRNEGLIANPNPYDAEEIADGAVKIPAKPDDGLWRLSPSTEPCPIE